AGAPGGRALGSRRVVDVRARPPGHAGHGRPRPLAGQGPSRPAHRRPPGEAARRRL
ncbi:MAG: hypothetical protein AVDCRST_MAG10-752, partial [uncultured Acidimicrobiales bacterium]